jgi:hypothetical protein
MIALRVVTRQCGSIGKSALNAAPLVAAQAMAAAALNRPQVKHTFTRYQGARFVPPPAPPRGKGRRTSLMSRHVAHSWGIKAPPPVLLPQGKD